MTGAEAVEAAMVVMALAPGLRRRVADRGAARAARAGRINADRNRVAAGDGRSVIARSAFRVFSLAILLPRRLFSICLRLGLQHVPMRGSRSR